MPVKHLRLYNGVTVGKVKGHSRSGRDLTDGYRRAAGIHGNAAPVQRNYLLNGIELEAFSLNDIVQNVYYVALTEPADGDLGIGRKITFDKRAGEKPQYQRGSYILIRLNAVFGNIAENEISNVSNAVSENDTGLTVIAWLRRGLPV